jgi:hypothetical protein
MLQRSTAYKTLERLVQIDWALGMHPTEVYPSIPTKLVAVGPGATRRQTRRVCGFTSLTCKTGAVQTRYNHMTKNRHACEISQAILDNFPPGYFTPDTTPSTSEAL